MANSIYSTLSRQSGLMKEMQVVANNIANVSTTGYRREGVIFAEHVASLEGDAPSLSMAYALGRNVNTAQGPLSGTGGTFDFAIEGEGFFMIETPEGNQLTRAGSFTPSPEGELVTMDGYRLLDSGGGPITVPPDAQIAVGQDGSMSANGEPIALLGVYVPTDPTGLVHAGGTRFTVEGDPLAVENPVILQGYIEESNVDPIMEVARMIEVQRAYEMGQTFLEREDERIRKVISTVTS
ncbi:flagellar basal-body rod protein FlgF [Thioclava sp. SK-1]|uniref:flagellar hook-basal body complex protein n=1 Tax=Thioclava sp. SK-1 TaxID=1889770 RepID=UPI0008259A5B|nr:flagellar hook-basal body complex protein [Thioclava sp. SK-1]OCX65394.1 flagellar basal-body rod protein FlgF [Thioclava sp. SK-1]